MRSGSLSTAMKWRLALGLGGGMGGFFALITLGLVLVVGAPTHVHVRGVSYESLPLVLAPFFGGLTGGVIVAMLARICRIRVVSALVGGLALVPFAIGLEIARSGPFEPVVILIVPILLGVPSGWMWWSIFFGENAVEL